MVSFKQAAVSVDGKKLAIRAEDLAAGLKKQPFCGLPTVAAVITGKEWAAKIKGKTVIIFFKDYWRRDGQSHASDDYIDRWNGAKLTSTGLLGFLETFARFPVGLQSFRGLYSNLGDSSEILSWEIN